MGRHKTKEEWIKLFEEYEKESPDFWIKYLGDIYFEKKKYKQTRDNFIRKYKRYKRFGESIIISMTGKKTGSGKGPKKKIDWDDFSREELVEIAKRYHEITKDKKKSEKDQEASSFTFSKSKLAFVLDISRSGLYYEKKAINKRDRQLEEKIEKAFKKSKGVYGRERIAIVIGANPRTVGRYMKALNLTCKVRAKKRRSERKNTNVTYKDLVKRNYNAQDVIATDVSYIQTDQGFAYLSIAINHATKKIESWNFSRNNDNELVMKHFRNMDLKNKIVHSDHGSQYSSHDFVELSNKLSFNISMSRIGNSLDNREAEYFFSNIKTECLYFHKLYKMSFEDVSKLIEEYIFWYNNFRIQKVLKWKTPEQVARVL